MSGLTYLPAGRPLKGACRVPGDKSITHRALILGAIADGQSRAVNPAPGGDCRSTERALRALGAQIEHRDGAVLVRGPIQPQGGAVDCGRSGTTMRLLAGVLAGRGVAFVLDGDPQLRARPMERVAAPLRMMGAAASTEGGKPPLRVGGSGLSGGRYRLPVASAQVKSALLLAGLRASGVTAVEEASQTRDHTERLLSAAGAAVAVEEGPSGIVISIRPGPIGPLDLEIPGDPSSAAFILAAAALVKGSVVSIEGVSTNPTRSAFPALLRRMGAEVESSRGPFQAPEPSGDLRLRQRPLAAVDVAPEDVPGLVDELPLLGLLATQAEGTTTIRGAGELRVKESDRIAVLARGLRLLGGEVEEFQDGFAVSGPTPLHGARVDSGSDHRLAMTFTLAGLISDGPVEVRGMEYIADSFPEFLATLAGLA